MANQGVGSWIHKRRVKSAGATALVHLGRQVTYDELAMRIDRLANALADRGIGKGDRVAYLGNNHPAFLETLFATGELGAIFVPLNTRLAPAEIAHALDDSGADILIHAHSLETLAVAGAALSHVTHGIVVPDTPVEVSTIGARVENYEDVIAASRDGHRDEAIGLDDPALIIYTSGTTGRPKGALLTHGNLTWNSLNVLTDYDISSTERSLMIAPLFHVASLGMGCLPTLLKGGAVILEERFEPARALALIEQERATFISGVPTTYQLICEDPTWASTDISSLRNLTCGGSAVPTRVREAYEARGLSFSGGYGMTETSPGVTALPASFSTAKAGSAGLPHFFTGVRVVDENDVEVPQGTRGEIQAQGPNAIHEYWNNPVASAELYSADGWLKTGDIGFLDENGFLFIADRLKDMIISGGENVYPAEVEQVIMQFDEISSVAVIGRPDEQWGEVPHAVITLAAGSTFDEATITTQLRDRLARYKVPKTWEIVDEMPRTASGKIRKHQLR